MAEQSRSQGRNRVGISRRDLLRRGAIVGGTVLWTVPIISTLTKAHVRPGSPAFTCCQCQAPGGGTPRPPKACVTSAQNPSVDNPTACQQFCTASGYKQSRFHAAPTPIQCRSNGNCGAH